MARRLPRTRDLWVPVAVFLAVTVGAAVLATTGATRGVDARLVDRHRVFAPLSDDLLVVGIDLRSAVEVQNQVGIEAIATTSPDVLARTVQVLVDAGASAVVLDDVLAPLDLRLRVVRQQVRDAGRVVSTWPFQVLGTEGGTSVGARELDDVLAFDVAAPGHDAFGDRGVGDGRPREVPLLLDLTEPEVDVLQSPVLSLAIAAVAVAEGVDAVQQSPGVVVVGDHRIPTTGDGRMVVTYSDALVRAAFDRTTDEFVDGVPLRDDFPATQLAEDVASVTGSPYVPLVDLLEGRVPPERLEGRIVLVASTGGGLVTERVGLPGADTVTTPVAWAHANAINTILTSSHVVPASDGEAIAVVVAAGLLALLAALLLPPWAGAPLVVATATGYVGIVGWRFPHGTMMGTVAPLSALLVGYLAIFGVRYVRESRQRRRIASLFGEYVPKAVADRLIADTGRAEDAAAGERAEVTVMFCDLRGFTSIAGRLAPTDVRDLLNVYYRRAAQVVLETRGTLMQYVGDEVFAVFGVPITPDDDHPTRALACAVELQRIAEDISAELADMGIPPIAYGIGVHTGEVVAAHVGDTQRRQYAVVGDAVNVGARLCSLAGAGEVVLSSAVRDRVTDPPAMSRMPPVELKGVERDLDLFRIDGGVG